MAHPINQSSIIRILSVLGLFLVLITQYDAVFAQQARTATGALKDFDGKSVIGASVRLITGQDTVQTSSDNLGVFTFNNVKAAQFELLITSLGFDTLRRDYTFEPGVNTLTIPPIILSESNRTIEAVTIQGAGAVSFKEDTLEYSTRNLKLREGALVEDALRQLDGVDVDKDGNVTAQGESVTRARINGRDYFGGDIKTAIQNLPADIVEKMQIVDDYGDMANLTGNRTGDPERVLNIMIDPARNKGSLGNFRVGGGTEDRYLLNGSYNVMNNSTELALTANANNVNYNQFNFSIGGGGARRGPGAGSFGAGFGGGSSGRGGAFGGANNGITNAQSFGLDLKHTFNDKLTTYGDYRFGHNDNSTLSTQFRNQVLSQTSNLISNINSTIGTISNNHRFSWNVEYKPTDKTFVKISPTFNISNTNTNNVLASLVGGTSVDSTGVANDEISKNFNPNYGISALFNRRLSDSGRNFFVNFALNSASTESDQEILVNTISLDVPIAEQEEVYRRNLVDLQNKSINGGASVSYIEPLGQYNTLEFSYDYNFANYNNDQINNTYDINGVLVGGTNFNFDRNVDYTFTTHRAGVTYRYRKNNFNYSFGAAVQPNSLSGTANLDGQLVDISRTGFNFVPVARIEYRPSRNKSFNLNYTGRASEPTFSQIRPYTDYSNSGNSSGIVTAVTGNPDLAAQFTHDLRLNFRNFDIASGSSVFASISGSLSEDRIVSVQQLIDDPTEGPIQHTSYVNADGFYSARGFYSYNKPIFNKQLTLMFNGNANFTNNVSYQLNRQTNIAEENIGKTWVLGQRVGFRYNPKETIEIMPNVGYTYNTTANSLQTAQLAANLNTSTWNYSLFSTINLSPTWIYGVDLTKTSNSGFSSTVNANPFIINTYIEKQFFAGKTGAIRFQAYDLLNEQTNVVWQPLDNGGSFESRSNRLARYFLLTLSYRFQKFEGGRAPAQEDSPWGPRPGGGGGFRP